MRGAAEEDRTCGRDARAPGKSAPSARSTGGKRNPAEGGAWVRGRPRPHVGDPHNCRRAGRGALPGCAGVSPARLHPRECWRAGRAFPQTPRRAETCGQGCPRSRAPPSAGLRTTRISRKQPRASAARDRGHPCPHVSTRANAAEPGRASPPRRGLPNRPGGGGGRPLNVLPTVTNRLAAAAANAPRLPQTCGQDARGPKQSAPSARSPGEAQPRRRRGWRVRGRPARGQGDSMPSQT